MHLSQNLIKHIINNQEKLIIVNHNGEPEVVLMPYKIYQNCCDNQKNNKIRNNSLTSDEFLDRINQNIAQWREQQNNPTDLEKDYFVKEEIADDQDDIDDEDRFYLETINSD
ncbi:MAG: hypothetical protein AAB525_01230 [Patescibacteria group bacterium]